MPGARRRGRPRSGTHGLDGQHQDVGILPAEESIRMTEDRDKWRKYVHGVANRRIEDGYRAEQGCTAHPSIEHSNSRFESILFVMRIDSFCKKISLSIH